MSIASSAGNSGSQGIFEVGVPSVGKHVLSVASVDNLMVLGFAAKTSKGELIGRWLDRKENDRFWWCTNCLERCLTKINVI